MSAADSLTCGRNKYHSTMRHLLHCAIATVRLVYYLYYVRGLMDVGLAAGVLRTSGLDAVLTDIAGGVVATLAVHAEGSRLPGAPMTLRQGRLRGTSLAVPHLSRAELVVTLARTEDGDTVAAVARC